MGYEPISLFSLSFYIYEYILVYYVCKFLKLRVIGLSIKYIGTKNSCPGWFTS